MLSKVLSIQALANELEALIDGNLLSINYCKPLKTTTVHIDERSMISLIKKHPTFSKLCERGDFTLRLTAYRGRIQCHITFTPIATIDVTAIINVHTEAPLKKEEVIEWLKRA